MSIFPLPLNAFERYMLADDRPDYPMTFFLRLHFQGTLDREHFEAAAADAIARHPLFRAVISDDDGPPCWVALDDAHPRIHWQAGARPSSEARFRQPIDLRREPGLRFSVEAAADGSCVLIEFHHTCCDGIGATGFVEDLLVAYAARSGGKTPSRPRPLNAFQLRRRGEHGLSFFGRLLRVPLDLLGACGVLQFFANRPVPLSLPAAPSAQAGESAPLPAEGDRPACLSHRFTSRQLQELRWVGRRAGATVNDLLVRDLFLALDQWNWRHDRADRAGPLRISVPVNLRGESDALLPAANVVSMVFLDRRPERFSNTRWFLKTIQLETAFIKRCRLALLFHYVIRLLSALPRGLARLLDGGRCLSTAVLSNLGVQWDDLPLPYEDDQVIAGDVRLRDIEFLPPIRPLTRISLGVVTYADELRVSLHYDRSLSSQAAEDFFAQFVDRLSRTAVGRRGIPRRSEAPVEIRSSADRPLVEAAA